MTPLSAAEAIKVTEEARRAQERADQEEQARKEAAFAEAAKKAMEYVPARVDVILYEIKQAAKNGGTTVRYVWSRDRYLSKEERRMTIEDPALAAMQQLQELGYWVLVEVKNEMEWINGEAGPGDDVTTITIKWDEKSLSEI